MIPLCDLKQSYESLKAKIDAAMQQVAAETRYILGPNVKALEHDVAEFCDCRHGVGVASGTDALELALRACGIGPGDAVFTVSHTAVATVAAIELAGTIPVLVDIDPTTFTMDPDCLEDAIKKWQVRPSSSEMDVARLSRPSVVSL